MLAVRAVEGGFADPVVEAQAVFRAVLDAFARPGTCATLGAPVSAPAPLVPAAAAVLAALADGDTPVWIDDPRGEASAWLRFQTGCPIVGERSAAAFAVLPEGTPAAVWTDFPVGTPDYPDRSATLILAVAGLTGGRELVLAGPGIETEMRIAPAGLPADVLVARAANRARFPLGQDLLLVAGEALMALPRTTVIREG